MSAARTPVRPAAHRSHGAPAFGFRPELTPISVAMCLLVAAPLSFALPTGPVNTSGQASVQTTAPGQLLIQQSTPRAGLDWTSFSIAAGERVNVVQPDRTSVLLNRVVGENPSLIYGALQSNGSVWLINPRGIVFGASSRVDVGGLVASTLSLSGDALAAGRLQLGVGAGGAGELRSEGQITAIDGTVALVAPQLVHSGHITARRVGLAAASEVLVDVEGDGLIFFNARNDNLDTRLALLGSVRADGGVADIRAAARGGFADTVLNLEGTVQARSIGMREGRIHIDGGAAGVTWIAGTLDASGRAVGEHGGDVLVQGHRVMLDQTATIDASGAAGGGRIRVGGDFQGANPEVRNADMLVARPGSTLAADATVSGHGGQVVLWSDDSTRFHGRLSARGGPLGGNGGSAEVSGKQSLEFMGGADLSAAYGQTGTLLLDPNDIRIETGGDEIAGNVGFGGGGTVTVKAAGTNSLSELLQTTNIALQADRTIRVLNAVDGSGGAGLGSLTLQAGRDITVDAALTARGITLAANDSGGSTGAAGKVVVNSPLNAGTGTLTITNRGLSGLQAGGGTHVLNGSLSGAAINITGSATLPNDAVWTTNSGTSTVSGAVDGNAALTKQGAGTLVLAANNTFSGGTTISAGTLQVGNGGTTGTLGSGNVTNNAALVFNRSDTLVVANRIFGTGTLEQAGTGVTTLTRENTYSGTTTVSAGTLKLGSPGGVAPGGDVVVNGTLDLAGFSPNINGLSGNGTIDNTEAGAVQLLVGGGSGTGTFSGTIQNSGGGALALTKTGSGTIVLSGFNNYSGTTTIDGGTLQIGAGGFTGTLGSGNVVNNAALVFNLSNPPAVTNAISGTGTLTQAGTGTLALSGNNSYSGGTTLASGTLRLDSANAIGTAGTVSFTGGTLQFTGSNTTDYSARFSNAPGQAYALDTNGQAVTLASALTSAPGTLSKLGAGTLTLSGDNTYGGPTTVSAGTLQIGAGGTTGTLNSGPVFNDAALVFNRSDAVTVANAISGTGTLEQAGTGTTTLTGNNNTYTGITTVSAGTLQIGNAGAPGTLGSGDVVNNAALVFNGPAIVTVANAISGTGRLEQAGTGTTRLTGANTYTGPTTVSAGTLQIGDGGTTGTLGSSPVFNDAALVFNRSNALTVANGIVGTGTLTQAGTGTLTLSGNNFYGGGTTLAGGTLELDGANAIGNAGTVSFTGGTLRFTPSNTTDYSARFSNAASQAYALDTNGQVVTLASALTSSGGTLSKLGAGTLTLSGNNSYGGTTTVSTGTLQVGDGGATGTLGSGNVVNNAALVFNRSDAFTAANAISGNGTLEQAGAGTTRLTGSNTYSGITTVSAGTLQVGDGGPSGRLGSGNVVNNAALVFNLSNPPAVTNEISGTGTLTQAGTGTLALSGNNSYSGGTTLASGTLRLDSANAIGTAGTVSFTGGALQFTGINTTDYSAHFSNAPGQAYALDTNGQNVTLATALTSAGGTLSKLGTGTLTLSGNNTYGGTTTVSTGTLQVGAGGTTGTLGSGNVVDNAALVFNRSDVAFAANDISGPGTLTHAGTGTLALNGNNSYGGGTTLAGGTLQLGSANAIGTAGTVSFTGGTLQFTASNTTDYSARFSNAASQAYALDTNGQAITLATALTSSGGTLSKLGAGTLTLTAANTYSGTTTVSAGTLQVGAGGTIGTLGSGNVVDNAALVFNRSNAVTVANAISGTGTLEQAGTGTTTLTGGNTYAGITTVSAGTLQVGAGGTTGTLGSGNVVDNAALVFNRSNALTVSGDISGTGTLTQAGTGTLTLSGNNGYSGGTTLAGGTLALGGTNAIGTTGTVSFAGGTLQFTASNATDYSGRFSNAPGQAYVLDTNAQAVALASTLTSPGGTLSKLGAGTLTLSGNNSYSGGTTLAGGTLALGSPDAIGTAGTVSFTGGALQFTASNTTDYSARFSNAASQAYALDTNGHAVTLASALTSSGGTLSKLGVGTLTLAAANTYSGITTITAGTLQVGNGGTTGTLGSGNVVDNAALVFNRSDAVTVANAISGTGTLEQAGTGTTTLTGGNTYAGITTVSTGTLQVGAGGTTGTLGSGNVVDNATLVFNRSDVAVVANAVSGTGTLTQAGPGTLTLSGNSGYSGGTTLAGGILALGSANAIGTAGTVSFAGGTLRFTASNTTDYSGRFSNAANQTYVLDTNGQDVTLASALTSAGGTLTKLGSGTLTLAAANAYSGTTTVSAGTLKLGLASALPSGTSAGNVVVDGTLDLAGFNQTVNGLSGNGTIDTTAAGAATLTVGANDAASTFSGVIQNSAGTLALTKAGSGTITLGGNSSYGGGTTFATASSSGTLALTANTAAGSGVVAVGGNRLDINSGANLDNAVTVTTGTVGNSLGTGGISASGSMQLGGNAALSSTGTRLTIAGVISETGGSRSLTTSGPVFLTGNNTYTGATTVASGTLTFSGPGAGSSSGTVDLGSSRVDIINGASVSGSFILSGGFIGNSAGAGALTGNVSLSSTSTFDSIGGSGLTVTGIISGAGGVIVPAGTVTFGGVNAYLGSTSLSGSGTLRLSGSSAIPDGSAVSMTAGTTLTLLSSETIGSLSATGLTTANVNLGASTLTTGGDGTSTAFNGTLVGGGSLLKVGAGTFTLGGANSYSGLTTISAGTLQVGAGGTTGTLGSGNVVNNAALVFNRSDALAVAVGISGSGTVQQAGSGTTTLSGSNSYAGITTVSAGALQIGAGSTAGTLGSGNVVNNAALVFNRSDAVTVTASISGTGTLEHSGTGSTTLTANNTFSGSTNVSGGALTLTGNNSYGDTSVGPGATLRVSGGGAAAGSGTIALSAGTLDIANGASVGNTVSYATGSAITASGGSGTLSAGTLVPSDGATLNLAGGASSTLTVSRVVPAVAGGASEAVNVSGGTVLFSVDNTYGGGTTVATGATLVLGAGGAGGSLGSGNVTLASGATLRVNRNDIFTLTQDIAGSVAGNGELQQVGSGTFVLTGTNSYGTTLINNGVLQIGNGGNSGTLGTGLVTVSSPGLLRFKRTGTIGAPGGTTGNGAIEFDGGAGNVVEFTAPSSYTGTTLVASGTLRIRFPGASAGTGTIALGAATLDIVDGASVANPVTLSNGATIANSSGTGTLLAATDASLLLVPSNGTLNFNSSGSGLSVARLIGGGNSVSTLVMSGSSTVTLGAANTYLGTTRIDGGTLALGVGNAIPSTTVAVLNGGTLALGAFSASVNAVSLLGGGISGSTGVLTSATAFDLQGGTVSAVLAGAVGIVKTTTATVTLSGANIFSGSTAVNAGKLLLAGNNVLPSGTAVSVAAAASLDLGADHVTSVSSLALSGTLDGTGTSKLSAISYALAGGTVNAQLGGGTLNATAVSTLNGSADAITVNVTGGTLTLGNANLLADAATVSVSAGAALNLGGADTIERLNLSGQLGGAGTLTASNAAAAATGGYALSSGTTLSGANLGIGTLSSAGASTLGGTSAASVVNVTGGTLTLGNANLLVDTATVTVLTGAALNLGGADSIERLNLFGQLGGNGTLTALNAAAAATGGYALSSGTTLAGANLGTGTLSSIGASTLGGTSAATLVNITGGTLALGNANVLADAATVTVSTGAALNLGGADSIERLNLAGQLGGTGTLTALNATAASTGGYALSSGTTLSGANLGAGTLSSTGTGTLGGTSAATAVNVTGGTLTLGTANVLADAATVTVSAGAALNLGGADSIERLNLAGQLGGTGTLTALNAAAAPTGGYALSSGTTLTGANLGTGTLSSTGASTLAGTSAATLVNVAGGTLTLGNANVLADTATVTVSAGAALNLSGADSIERLNLSGQLGGTGMLMALNAAAAPTGGYALSSGTTLAGANLGIGTLSSTGTSTLGGTSAATAVNVTGGTLTLGNANLLADTAAVTVSTGAALNLGGADTIERLNLSGQLGGTGTLTALNAAAAATGGYALSSGTTLAGANLGTGTLSSTGTSTLGGTSAATAVNVTGGTLTLGNANVLADTATVTISAGAALNLGGADSIERLNLSGQLGGTGTLTALNAAAAPTGGYALNSGTTLAGANLGAGTLSSTGTSTLGGTSVATAVNVIGGTLTLGNADVLADAATVAVSAGAVLNLGGADTIEQLNLAGQLGGAGTLTALNAAAAATGGYALSSGTTVSGANLGIGTLSSSGASTLGGASAATAVNVTGGTLTLGHANVLADTATVTVSAGAALHLGGADSIERLNLTGQLGGLGTLTALNAAAAPTGGYALSSGTTLSGANLGIGTLSATGASTLGGTSAATTVNVSGGRLTLGNANVLADAATVTVSAGAALNLGGADTIERLNLFGQLGGTGTLTALNAAAAPTGGYALSSGTTLTGANLGTGTMSSTGASTLGGTSAATAVIVTGGTLAMGSTNLLADTTTVTVSAGAALNLSGADTIERLNLSGQLGGTGTLTALNAAAAPTGGYALSSGTTLAGASLGTGTLSSTGTSTLGGTSAANAVNVTAGTLTLGSANLLADAATVTVATGAALSLSGADTIERLNLAGQLGGAGTLTALNAAAASTGGYALAGGTTLTGANLGIGTLSSTGTSTLGGTTDASALTITGGTLTLNAAGRLANLPSVAIGAGARAVFSGDQAMGTLAGQGDLALGSFTVTTGSGGSSIFEGVISGTGGLIKQGSSSVFTLTGANSYTGATRIDAGTLRVGAGGTTGSLATSAIQTSGTLSFVRSDDVTLAQPVSGSGNVEQAGNGRLLFSGNNKTYGGDTLVTTGQLATAGADELPDASRVRVAANGRLALGGRETVLGVDADGSISLGPELAASGDLLMRGAVSTAGAVQLTGQRIAALNEGNRFGGTVSVTAGGELSLSSGRGGTGTGSAAASRDLVLGTVNAAAGGRVDAGLLSLTGVTTVTGSTLSLVSAAPLTALAPGAELTNRQATSLPIVFAADAVVTEAGSRLNVAAGAGLNVIASNGGSVQLLGIGNRFLGNLSVVSGAPDTPWSANSTALAFGGATLNYAVQSRVRIAGDTVNIGGAGIVADVVAILADSVSTAGTAAIVAKLPFDSTAGTATALPALTLELTPAAFTLSFPFGAPGAEGGLRVSVGSRDYGNRVLPIDAGYVTVLPRDGASGSTAVLLRGPVVNPSGGYRFFFDGAGSQTQIPVFYNGVLPTTPQVESSISATVAVSEGARKAGFDDAVRTENVAVRLRAGVIAEVGPAPSATQGTEGLRVPAGCTPAPGALLCGSGS